MIDWSLQAEGWDVSVASDGREALDAAIRRRPALVVLDIHLPVFDGRGFARALYLAYGGSVPVIMITADPQGPEIARRYGFVGYLLKPFEMADLIKMIRRSLELA